LSRNKAASINELARSLTNGALDIPAISRMPDDHAIAELVKFKGIGTWTAEMFLLFGLRRLDMVSYRDAGLRRGVRLAYGFADSPTDAELTRLFDNWCPYRGVGCWYMWQVAD
jgi:DNA-3-methyladenine glycosylase II